MIVLVDEKMCGVGEGATCCAFLTMGREDFQCGRADESVALAIRARLEAGTMNAAYDPGDLPFPTCQKERPRANEG